MSCRINDLLLQLIFSQERSRFTVILDEGLGNGRRVLSAYLKPNASQSTLILLENRLARFCDQLQIDPNKLEVHNLFSRFHKDESTWFSHLLSLDTQGRWLFIDSLAPLFIMYDTKEACRVLQKMSSDCGRMVSTIQACLLDDYQLLCLREIASTVIELNGDPSVDVYDAVITHKKAQRYGIKLLRERTCFKIQPNLDVQIIKKDQMKEITTAEDTSQLIKSLPFNLNLSEEERMNKDKLTLPYTKSRTSKVYYEPGKEDDVDEEDPDEDLLI